MHRFYLPPNLVSEREITLDDRESHHAANVLRVREGERVAVLNGAGTELMCEVAAVDKKGRAVEGAATKRYCSITVSDHLVAGDDQG